MRLARGSFFVAAAMAAALGAGGGARASGEASEARAQAFLGVALEEDGPAGRAVIGAVLEGTAAEAAGLREGDAILAVCCEEVAGPDALREAIAAKAPGEEVALLVERDGWRKTFVVTLAKRPAEEESGDDDDDDGGDGGS
jgi:S1-C subfamily serine protease